MQGCGLVQWMMRLSGKGWGRALALVWIVLNTFIMIVPDHMLGFFSLCCLSSPLSNSPSLSVRERLSLPLLLSLYLSLCACGCLCVSSPPVPRLPLAGPQLVDVMRLNQMQVDDTTMMRFREHAARLGLQLSGNSGKGAE